MPVHVRKSTDFNMPQISGAASDNGSLIALLDTLLVESQFSHTCTITSSGTTATLTVSGGHGYGTPVNSNTVWINVSGANEAAFNKTSVQATIASSSTLTYTIVDQSNAPATGTITVRKAGKAISSITRSGTVATATCTSHGLGSAGGFAYLTISGASQSEYNLTNTKVTIVDADTFTYTVSGSATTPATGSPEWKFAAAGWSKTVLAANKVAYRMPASTAQFYLVVDETVSQYWADIYGCESLGMDGITPTTLFPKYYASHMSYAYAFLKGTASSTVNKDWKFFSNGECFYLFGKYISSSYYGGSMFFGNFESVRHTDSTPVMIIGSEESTRISSSGSRTIGNISARNLLAYSENGVTWTNISSTPGGCFARFFNSTGAANNTFRATPSWFGYNNGSGSQIFGQTNRNEPSEIDSLDLMKVTLIEHGTSYISGQSIAGNAGATWPVHRGYMPGIYDPLHPRSSFIDGQVYEGNGDNTGKKWMFVESYVTTVNGGGMIEVSDTW